MPEERPGERYYAVATAQLNHGQPVLIDGITGIALKQSHVSGTAAMPTGVLTIAIGETFVVDNKGVVLVPVGAITPTKGTLIYINNTGTNALQAGATNGVPYGRIWELAGERGCPTGFMRVHLDYKS